MHQVKMFHITAWSILKFVLKDSCSLRNMRWWRRSVEIRFIIIAQETSHTSPCPLGRRTEEAITVVSSLLWNIFLQDNWIANIVCSPILTLMYIDKHNFVLKSVTRQENKTNLEYTLDRPAAKLNN